MFSQKNLTTILLVVIGVLIYQTATLAVMTTKLQDAQFGIGVSPSAINLNDNGDAPQMVGGC
jgi:hypothetical protein